MSLLSLVQFFTAKDEMLMRGIGMQDAPLFSTQWNNEELLKKNAIIFTYVDSMTIRVKENWKTDDLFWVAPSGLSLIFFLRNYLFKISVSFKYFIQWRIRNFFLVRFTFKQKKSLDNTLLN